MNQKVLINIIVQMIRSGMNLGLSLFTSRIILKALGEDDYGLYCLLSGFIVFFAFIQSSLSTSIQRYLAYYLGKGNIAECRGYLLSGYTLYSVGGFVLCLFCYIVCMVFFNDLFEIDPQKESLARIILLIVIISFFIGLIQSPTYSVLYAHECFTTISSVHIFDIIVKFVGAMLLLYASQNDRLILYALLILLIHVIKGVLFLVFSLKFEETRGFKLRMLSLRRFKDIFSLSGYVVFSLVGRMGRLQGITLIINHEYGVKVNGSWGIAQQVGSATRNLATPVQNAFDPLIVKREGHNNREDVIKLSIFSSKIGFLLFSTMALPIIFNINWILDTWLTNPPRYSAILCVMFITGILAEQITFGLSSAFMAVGKVSVVFIVTGIIRLLSVPLMFFAFRLGGSIILFSVIYCVLELVCTMVYLVFFITITHTSVSLVLYGFLTKILAVFVSLVSVCFVISLLGNGLMVLLVSASASVVTCLVSSWIFGFSKEEKVQITNIFLSLKARFLKR